MQMYKDYKSPLGYEVGEDGIDSYGVNHNRFSTRDEVEYQMARNQREQQLMQNYNNQGITENYPQYGTDFWGDNAYNNYGFGTSDISSNIDGVTSQLNNQGMSYNSQYSSIGQPYNSVPPQTPTPWSNNNSASIPRIWENAADGKRVYDYVLQQEGNFIPPNQNLFEYISSAVYGGMDLLDNFSKIRKMNATDKYKHALMNCYAAQYGQGGADVSTLASNLREWYDKQTGANTLDSSNGDQYANKIGRLLGGKYPEDDCDELVQKYIDKHW